MRGPTPFPFSLLFPFPAPLFPPTPFPANDHLTGIFKTTYQLMRQAGVPCWEWEFEHPRHGFSWGPRKENGAYNPDTVQQKALEQTIEFFNTHVMRMKKLE